MIALVNMGFKDERGLVRNVGLVVRRHLSPDLSSAAEVLIVARPDLLEDVTVLPQIVDVVTSKLLPDVYPLPIAFFSLSIDDGAGFSVDRLHVGGDWQQRARHRPQRPNATRLSAPDRDALIARMVASTYTAEVAC